MQYFPAFFDLTSQKVLVVGGGEVALRKVILLERSGALITLVAPVIVPEIRERVLGDRLTLVEREFIPDDLDGARLVIVATSHRAVNRWIAKLADARAIPANVVDDREASRFIVPAIIDRDPVIVAISTGGTSPVLARRLREKLEALIPKRLGALALWLQELRRSARNQLRGTAQRRRFFESIVDGAAAQRFIEGDHRGAERISRQLLARTSAAAPAPGSVTLVGAGPGDPELLTLKALRALQDADVILYDRLVSEPILDLVRRDAELICVGKSAGSPSTGQEEINALLILYARQGKRVVRLKGGDPFVFGRGGEELEALAHAQVDFTVVPGITAAAGCAAYAGIPLTHRDHAQSVTFVTGHHDAQGKEPHWQALAMPGATVVFYMGLARLEHIVEKLTAHGAPPDRPAAIITSGTTENQRVVAATLSTLVGRVAGERLGSPSLLIVGDVVGLHESLAWFGAGAPLGAPDVSLTG